MLLTFPTESHVVVHTPREVTGDSFDEVSEKRFIHKLTFSAQKKGFSPQPSIPWCRIRSYGDGSEISGLPGEPDHCPIAENFVVSYCKQKKVGKPSCQKLNHVVGRPRGMFEFKPRGRSIPLTFIEFSLWFTADGENVFLISSFKTDKISDVSLPEVLGKCDQGK